MEYEFQEYVLRMVAEAEKLDADAVADIRYTSSAVMRGIAEVIVYGTAVNYSAIE
jgi:uncharacterized protein YbjQ (UPF0145 family)